MLIWFKKAWTSILRSNLALARFVCISLTPGSLVLSGTLRIWKESIKSGFLDIYFFIFGNVNTNMIHRYAVLWVGFSKKWKTMFAILRRSFQKRVVVCHYYWASSWVISGSGSSVSSRVSKMVFEASIFSLMVMVTSAMASPVNWHWSKTFSQ